MNQPTRLGTDLPTQIAKRGKIISPGSAIPMRVGCWLAYPSTVASNRSFCDG